LTGIYSDSANETQIATDGKMPFIIVVKKMFKADTSFIVTETFQVLTGGKLDESGDTMEDSLRRSLRRLAQETGFQVNYNYFMYTFRGHTVA
jgi:hypothetical protein